MKSMIKVRNNGNSYYWPTLTFTLTLREYCDILSCFFHINNRLALTT